MAPIQYFLVVALALVVATGLVYLLRPQAAVELSPPLNIPTPTLIDNTLKLPPETPDPNAIRPISQTIPTTLKTSLGDIDLELDGIQAPITVGNFVYLAQLNFYDRTLFHRVIPNFMIQGGDPTGTGRGGPGYQFKDEINNQKIVRGSLAMANAGPGTNGSQFFIVTGEAFPNLDGKHTVFGKVVAGMDIVDQISQVEADASDKPLTPVVIQDIVIQ